MRTCQTVGGFFLRPSELGGVLCCGEIDAYDMTPSDTVHAFVPPRDARLILENFLFQSY